MRPREVLATVLRWVGHIGTVAFLWSIGGSAISAAALRSVTALSWPWIALLAVGVGCVILASIGTYRTTRRRKPTKLRPTKHPAAKSIQVNNGVPEEIVRAEWDATCEPVSESLGGPFGRGVRLSIESKEGEKRDLRCVVTAPDGTRYRSVRRLEGFRSGSSSRDRFHWPGEFESKPQTPWTPGYYSYAWSGLTGVGPGDAQVLLARITFDLPEGYTFG